MHANFFGFLLSFASIKNIHSYHFFESRCFTREDLENKEVLVLEDFLQQQRKKIPSQLVQGAACPSVDQVEVQRKIIHPMARDSTVLHRFLCQEPGNRESLCLMINYFLHYFDKRMYQNKIVIKIKSTVKFRFVLSSMYTRGSLPLQLLRVIAIAW